MPVADDHWLDLASPTPTRHKLPRGIKVAPIEIPPVSRDINRVGPNRADLINAVAAAYTPLSLALASPRLLMTLTLARLRRRRS